MTSAHLDSLRRLGSFEERGNKQDRNFRFSQLGAGSGILERELPSMPAPGGPCLALCVEKVAEFVSHHRQQKTADCHSGKCKAKQICS